ncbi:hypothetical protein GCM10007301_26010 [Azorhizobium oxalatiphilum]|uniref:Transmembrane protein n=1 Tax=Azorhizobium oxalatiphilum TaxID=980631 RepID=A0A917C173_9HYPH|nr:hypothetical protein [Azorhizobium oxalatiphilum]GGF65006.1 hypothetical protein GCM10007301_26010 [Azorhizobium oxalatiphilum]
MSSSKSGAIESYDRPPDELKTSDRGFGKVMAVVFAIIAGFQFWHERPRIAGILAGIALVFALATWLKPSLLHGLNRQWFRLGLFLHKIVNPVVMAVIFMGAVVPTALVMRALGKRPLNLAIDRTAQSYWVVRDPPGPARDSLKRQF